MKKSALFILFALISVAGCSQITGWNAKVGMNISNYTGDADLNAKIGFKLGGGFEYAFDNTWSLQPSLFLSTKGAKKDGNSINAMYLELPVMAAARIIQILWLMLVLIWHVVLLVKPKLIWGMIRNVSMIHLVMML